MMSSSKIVQFEYIIDEIGAFGYWQRILFVLLSLPDIWGAFAMLLPVFTGATPRWSCHESAGPDMNGTLFPEHMWKVCSVNDSQCETFVYHDEFTSIVSEWDLVCSKDYISDLISSIQMGGLVMGAVIFGLISDLIGRKKSYFIALSILLLSGFISAFANSWQFYAACRALVGVGFASYMVVNCVYPLEFVGSRWRLLCGTLGFWAVGHLLLAPLAYFLRDWRHLTIAVSISGVPCFLMWWAIPESPRWLVQKGHFQEAEEILAKIAVRNKKPPPDLAQLKQFAEHDEKLEREIRKFTYLDLFRQWHYARTTVITSLLWFISFLMFYKSAFNIKHLSGDRYLNMFFSGLMDLVAMFSVIGILNWLGRKKSLIGYFLICLSSLLTVLLLKVLGTEVTFASFVTYISMIGKSAALSATYVCQIYSAEVFPTDIRNMGVGIGSIAGRIGGIVSPQLVFLGTIYQVAPYIIIIALCALLIPTILLLPETNGKPLKDDYMENKALDREDLNMEMSHV